MRRFTLATLAAVAIGLAPLPAAADGTSPTSTISQMKVLEKSHRDYTYFHGALWLDYDKARVNYRWGGKHCGDQGLSDVNLGILFAAFRNKYSVKIDYKTSKVGKYSYRCITGFTIERS